MDSLFKTLVLCLVCISAASAKSPDYAENCNSCHGVYNDQLDYQAPQLSGLKADYIFEQMKNYREGLRGRGSKAAAAMAAAVQQYDEEQLKQIASWASDREGKRLLAYEKDSADPGAVLFVERCQGCHQSFMGRLMTGSPRLDYLGGEYMVAQLDLFRADERQIPEPDKHQVKMVAVVKSLNEEELGALMEFLLDHTSNN